MAGKLRRNVLVAVLAGLLAGEPGWAATVVLTLSATGTILPAPVWQNAASAPITTLAFSFAGLFAGPTPATNVDSAATVAKLVNAPTYPATVALIRPATCTIGAAAVTAANVHFLNNGVAVTTNSNISIANNANQTYALRFAAAGNHGSQSGAIACAVAGTLTYTY